jgi:hypothetical protein
MHHHLLSAVEPAAELLEAATLSSDMGDAAWRTSRLSLANSSQLDAVSVSNLAPVGRLSGLVYEASTEGHNYTNHSMNNDSVPFFVRERGFFVGFTLLAFLILAYCCSPSIDSQSAGKSVAKGENEERNMCRRCFLPTEILSFAMLCVRRSANRVTCGACADARKHEEKSEWP